MKQQFRLAAIILFSIAATAAARTAPTTRAARRKAAFALCFLALILPARRAAAVEEGPGDSCAGIPANSFRWAGAPENGGVMNGMYCESNAWSGVITFKSSGNVGIGTTAPGAALDVQPNLTGAAGTIYGVKISPAINTSGTSAYTALLVNATETTVGSAQKNILDLQSASAWGRRSL